MGSLLLFAVVMLQSISTANNQATASIEGIVVDDQMQPIAGAEVHAAWEPPPIAIQADKVPHAFTDSAGKFVIANLAPGGYRISVSDARHVPQIYGAKSSGYAGSVTGTVILVVPGQTVREITIRMTQMSTISGRVLSSAGEPLTGMEVDALRAVYDSSGLKTLVGANSGAQTDDRGEFRIAGISPGRYYIRAATPGDTTPNELRLKLGRSPVSSGAYATMYFPGTADVSGASFVEVREREEVEGINIVLPRLPTFKIRGHFLDANGKPPIRPVTDEDPKPPIRPMIGVMPIQPDFISSTSMSVTPYCGTSPKCENPDGAFELTDVAPGLYWITAQILEPLTPAQRQQIQTPGADPSLLPLPLRAMAEVRITNSDVDGLELKLQPKLSISGRVLIDDSSLMALPAADSIKIGFRQSYAGVFGPTQIAVFDDQGKFTTGNLLPGDYRLVIRDLPQGVFLVGARMGDHDALAEDIRILSPQADELNIQLSAKSGRVSGLVVDSLSKPVANATVVLVPDQPSSRPDLYKTATSKNDGRFQIEGIAPGDYTAFSWEALEDYAYFDPVVVRQFELKGKSVHVVESIIEDLRVVQIAN